MKQKHVFYLIFIGFAMLILLLNILTPMAADDYTYAYSFADGERIASISDIFTSLAEHMRSFNGRAVPHFFVHLFTMLPRGIFILLNTLMYQVLVVGMYKLCNRNIKHDSMRLCLIEAGLLLLIPAFGQSFLWLAGSLNYLWCDALLMLLLVQFAKQMLAKQYKASMAVQITMPLVALLFGNMSENVSTVGIMMMGMCILYLLISKRPVPLWIWITEAMAVIGWAALIFAPCNTTRILGADNNLLENYDRAMRMFMDYGLVPSLVYLVLLAVSIYSPLADKNRILFSVGLFICAILCNFAMIQSSYYPIRVFTGTMVLLISASLFLLPMIKIGSSAALAIVLCTLLLSGLTGVDAIRDNYDRYRLMQARNQEVTTAAANGETDVITFGIGSRSKFDVFFNIVELTSDAQNRVNITFAKYYGLNSVIATRTE